MSIYSFNLPDLGEGLIEAQLVEWLASINDHIVEDQPLLSIETDKALVEIPSPVSGTLIAVHAKPGEIVAVGRLLAEFDTATIVDSGAIVGTLATPSSLASARTASVDPIARKDINKPDASSIQERPQASNTSVMASPLVRARSRELGIDLNSVFATGKNGTVTLNDLDHSQNSVTKTETLKGLRRAMFQNMTMAHQQVVLATVTGTADINHWHHTDKPLVRLVNAIVKACAEEPALNCWFDSVSHRRTLHSDVHLGIATDTSGGLLVPTLHCANTLDTGQCDDALVALQQSAKMRKLRPDQLSGQTISLSNFGSIAGQFAQMIVIPPQVAIVGAGTITETPVADGGSTAIHALLPLSVTFDHRVVSGGETARFLKALITALET